MNMEILLNEMEHVTYHGCFHRPVYCMSDTELSAPHSISLGSEELADHTLCTRTLLLHHRSESMVSKLPTLPSLHAPPPATTYSQRTITL